jgi:hypothetical protein
MAEYRTLTTSEFVAVIDSFGSIEYQDHFGNDLVAHSFTVAESDSPDFSHYLTVSTRDSAQRFTFPVLPDYEFYALVPHKMDSVVLHDSVVKAMESVYAAMMAANAVGAGAELNWAWQNSIYGALEMTLVKMLLDISDNDTAWANNVLNSIISAGEVRCILSNYTATPDN